MLSNTTVASDCIVLLGMHVFRPADRPRLDGTCSPAFGGRAVGAVEPIPKWPGQARIQPLQREIRSMTQHLIGEDRYVFVLLDEASDVIEPHETTSAGRRSKTRWP